METRQELSGQGEALETAESPARRRLVKALVAGAGAAGAAGLLPRLWVRPVVDVVKAHETDGASPDL